MDKKAQQVLRTKNYDQFKVFDFNRGINKGLVAKIMESIQEIGYMPGKPVIVDQNMAIIDGQHRFTACVNLGIEVEYVITEVDPHKAIIQLNSNQVHWKMQDYVNSWAEQGVKCYIHLKDFEERRKFGMTNSVLILFSSHSDSSEVKRIKEGYKFQINPKAETIAAYINACSGVPYYKSSYFIKAVVRMFRMADEHALEKVKNGIMSLPQQPSAAAYLQAFENIANRGVHAKNRISFKTTTH